jgi:hypothetical protein
MLRPSRIGNFVFGAGAILATFGLGAAPAHATPVHALPVKSLTPVHALAPTRLFTDGFGPPIIYWGGPWVNILPPSQTPYCQNLTVEGYGFGGGGWVEVDLWRTGDTTPTSAWAMADLSGDGYFSVTIPTPTQQYGYLDQFWVTAHEAGGPYGQSDSVSCIGG